VISTFGHEEPPDPTLILQVGADELDVVEILGRLWQLGRLDINVFGSWNLFLLLARFFEVVVGRFSNLKVFDLIVVGLKVFAFEFQLALLGEVLQHA
jgi:hypothetical protein